MNKRIIPLLALAAAGVAGSGASAKAALMLSADVSGVLFSCVDQAACDNNPNIGQLGLGTAGSPLTVNGVDVFGSLHIAQGIPGDPGSNFLSSSSLQVVNTSGAARTLTLAVGATDFTGPVGSFSTAGSGTFLNTVGSTVALRYFIDAANSQGGESSNDTPGISVTPFDYVATNNPDAFSHQGSGGISIVNPYSMTLQSIFTLDGDGRLVSRGQSMVTNVPEPVSLAIFGTALIGLAFAARTRRSRF